MLSSGLDGTDRFILLYPTGGLASMNMSCVFRTREEKAEATESWNADGDMAEMLEIFKDFDENVTKLFRQVIKRIDAGEVLGHLSLTVRQGR